MRYEREGGNAWTRTRERREELTMSMARQDAIRTRIVGFFGGALLGLMVCVLLIVFG